MGEFRKLIKQNSYQKGICPTLVGRKTLGSLLCVSTDLNTDGLTLYKMMTSVYSPILRSVRHFLIAGVCHVVGHMDKWLIIYLILNHKAEA